MASQDSTHVSTQDSTHGSTQQSSTGTVVRHISEKPIPSIERDDLDPMTAHHADGVEYQSMKWWQAGMVMVAETISLGILSLPQAMSTVGVIPGLILLLGLGAFASYSGIVIGQFKLEYPHIHSMECAGRILFGKWGGRIIGTGQVTSQYPTHPPSIFADICDSTCSTSSSWVVISSPLPSA